MYSNCLKLWFLQASNTQMEESLQETLTKCEKVEKELAGVRQQYEARQQEGDSVDAQARAEKKVYGIFKCLDLFLIEALHRNLVLFSK
jgi:hypothetical protein